MVEDHASKFNPVFWRGRPTSFAKQYVDVMQLKKPASMKRYTNHKITIKQLTNVFINSQKTADIF